MFCSKCGKKLSDNAGFCSACGAACSKAPAVSENQPIYNPPAQPVITPAQPVYQAQPVNTPAQPIYQAQPVNTPARPGIPPIVDLIIELVLMAVTFVLMFTTTFTYSSYSSYFSRYPVSIDMFGGGIPGFSDAESLVAVKSIFIFMFVVSFILALMPLLTRKWSAAFLIAAAITSIVLFSYWLIMTLVLTTTQHNAFSVSVWGWIFASATLAYLVFTFVTISNIKRYARRKALYNMAVNN